MSSQKYNSLLFGNGLLIYLTNIITDIQDDKKKLLNFSTFLNYFIDLPDHSYLKQNYYRYFQITPDTMDNHNKAIDFIKLRLNGINKMGFESWAGLIIFNHEIPKEFLTYIYLLYNYWFDQLNQQVLIKQNMVIKKISDDIKQHLFDNNSIFTLNFDSTFDEYLKPEHIHGRFQIPLKKIRDVIIFFNNDEFGYSYLFGTSGIEKKHQIQSFKNLNCAYYDLSFFYSEKLDLENLLIFGISFGSASIVSESFLKKYKTYRSFTALTSVDGHIIERLEEMYQNNKIKSITITYYSDAEKIYFNKLFNMTKIKKIVSIQHYSNFL